jgi:hypothetical protein
MDIKMFLINCRFLGALIIQKCIKTRIKNTKNTHFHRKKHSETPKNTKKLLIYSKKAIKSTKKLTRGVPALQVCGNCTYGVFFV